MPTTPASPPQQKPTMYDVARLAGVSHQTVSRVVNGGDGVRPAVRARVQQAISMLSYRRSVAAADLAGAHRHIMAALSVGGADPRCVEMFIGLHAEALRRGRQTVGSLIDPVNTIGVGAALDAILGHRPSSMVAVLADIAPLPQVRAFSHRHELTTIVVSASPISVDDRVGCVALQETPVGATRVDSAWPNPFRELGAAALAEAARCEAGEAPRARVVQFDGVHWF